MFQLLPKPGQTLDSKVGLRDSPNPSLMVVTGQRIKHCSFTKCPARIGSADDRAGVVCFSYPTAKYKATPGSKKNHNLLRSNNRSMQLWMRAQRRFSNVLVL